MSTGLRAIGLAHGFGREEQLPRGLQAIDVDGGLAIVCAAAMDTTGARRQIALSMRAAASLAAFLPLGAPTDPDRLAHAIAGEEERIVMTVERLRGQSELVLSLVAPRQARLAHGIEAASGRAWLRARMARRQADIEASARLAEAAEAVAGALGRPCSLSSGVAERTLDATLLVPRALAVSTAIEAERRLGRAEGVAAHLVSGPWPCFAFGASLAATWLEREENVA